MSRKGDFTARQKEAIRERAGHKCENCGDPGVDVDHIHACGLGGTRDLDNGRLLCVRCHKSKTDSDKASMSKVRRIAGNLKKGSQWQRTNKHRGKLQSRGFDKRLTRGFDGKVRER